MLHHQSINCGSVDWPRQSTGHPRRCSLLIRRGGPPNLKKIWPKAELFPPAAFAGDAAAIAKVPLENGHPLISIQMNTSFFGNSPPAAIRRGKFSLDGSRNRCASHQKSSEDRLLPPCLPIRTGRHGRLGRRRDNPSCRDTGDTTRDAERRNSNAVNQITSSDTCRQKSIDDKSATKATHRRQP